MYRSIAAEPDDATTVPVGTVPQVASGRRYLNALIQKHHHDAEGGTVRWPRRSGRTQGADGAGSDAGSGSDLQTAIAL
jgi:hypothetical protein